jgi:hypothetical protein
MTPTIIAKTSRQTDRYGLKHLLPTGWTSLLPRRSTQSGRLMKTHPRDLSRQGSHTRPVYGMLVASDVGGKAYSYFDEI